MERLPPYERVDCTLNAFVAIMKKTDAAGLALGPIRLFGLLDSLTAGVIVPSILEDINRDV